MAGTEVAAALHISKPDSVSSRLDQDDPSEHTDHGENASSGSNEDIISDHSPAHHGLPGGYDGGDLPIHRCEKCETYETISRAALISHMTRCVNNNNDVDSDGARRGDRKLFECDVCSMKFSNGANMRRHKMRHTGVKPYECRVCQKRFFRKDHLAEHFTTHTKTLPYHCPICNRGFQRQIAMRAHFQNEHVGQHDMIKSCPLCSFRAGTMKSLRVHFFNRHGIDLDNPSTGPPSIMCLRDVMKTETTQATTAQAVLGDLGESQLSRSADNITPPMHFLTPHVEISMTESSSPYSPGHTEQSPVAAVDSQNRQQPPVEANNCSVSSGDKPPASPTGSTDSCSPPINLSAMPALSVIPIAVKQELTDDDSQHEKRSPSSGRHQNGSTNGPMNLSKSVSPTPQNLSTSPSLIKVSPLKTLLRDDLKRKLTNRNNVRVRLPPTAHEPPPPVSMSLIRELNLPAAITQQLASLQEDPNGKKDNQNNHLLPQNLQCVFCGIWFPDQTLYFLHKGCHCDSNPWKCNICGEQCGNVYQFNSHLLSNTHQ